MFSLTDTPIPALDIDPLHPHAGGVVTFEGKVRAWNEGKPVTAIDYEAYTALALREGEAILAEAVERFWLLGVLTIHRTGHLPVGEVAVRVQAAAMHRRAAFEGAEFIIHQIKHRLPIWKKEWYADGSHDWVFCRHGEAA